MSKTPPFELGQVVQFKAHISKSFSGSRRVWRRWEMPGSGIYVGYRTVYDGWMQWATEWGDEQYFVREGQFRVILVVQNERHNPIRVLPEDMESPAKSRIAVIQEEYERLRSNSEYLDMAFKLTTSQKLSGIYAVGHTSGVITGFQKALEILERGSINGEQ